MDLPAELDALIAAPRHHTLLMENEQVRVLDTRVGPGETVPLHTHCWPSVLYILSWSDFVRRNETGGVVLDSCVARIGDLEGQAVWSPPLAPHTLENVGEKEIRAIAVEQKKA
jgi:mannose-6-phosphate isomerase-like protein (cupin superfamily)